MNWLDSTAPGGRARPPSDPDRFRAHRKEVSAMFASAQIIRAIHDDRAARFEAEARADRYAAEIRAARIRRDEAGRRRIRRAIGRSIVRVGQRIAADRAAETLPAAGAR